MKIHDFRTRKGSARFTMTAGHRIAPLVAETLAEWVAATVRADDASCRLLDVACGSGTLALRLARELPDMRISGVDASPNMIAQAQERATSEGLANERLSFAPMDAQHLAFAPASFDAATCNLGFPFFAHPAEAMAEIRRVLVPGAPFWASVPDRQSWREFFEVVYEVVPNATQLLRGFMARLEQAQRILPSLEQAGFEVTHQELLRLPFAFANGHEAVTFFNDLFSLFTTLPAPLERRLSRTLDERFPGGVATSYVALLTCARRDDAAVSVAPAEAPPSATH